MTGDAGHSPALRLACLRRLRVVVQPCGLRLLRGCLAERPAAERAALDDGLHLLQETDLRPRLAYDRARGVLTALAIADCANVEGFILGTNDLAKDIGCATGEGRMALMGALQTCLMAARAGGIACVDGVYNKFRDDEGLKNECEQGRALGMDAKTLIHPAQIDIANAVFAPSEAAIDLARRQISAFDEAAARGEGVAVVDGKIVENLHIETARAVLARADAIRAREAT